MKFSEIQRATASVGCNASGEATSNIGGDQRSVEQYAQWAIGSFMAEFAEPSKRPILSTLLFIRGQ